VDISVSSRGEYQNESRRHDQTTSVPANSNTQSRSLPTYAGVYSPHHVSNFHMLSATTYCANYPNRIIQVKE
jgi:hypothetical protein